MKPITWQFECDELSIHISCTQKLFTLKQQFVISINGEVIKTFSMSIFYTFIRMEVLYQGSEVKVLIAPRRGFRNKLCKSGAQVYLNDTFMIGNVSRDLDIPELSRYSRLHKMGAMKYIFKEGILKSGFAIGIGMSVFSFFEGKYHGVDLLRVIAVNMIVYMLVSGSILGASHWYWLKTVLKIHR